MKTLLKLVLLSIFLMVSIVDVDAATYYSRQTGNWSQTTTWSTVSCGGASAAAVPSANDVVFICNAHTVSVTANSNVTSVTVQSGGTLRTGTTGGGANKTLTISGNFILLSGGTYIHNNNQVAATTIFAGTESFAAGSTFRVTSWSGITASIITGCTSNFGNLSLEWNPGAFYWSNDGLGYTRTILGNFTVNNGCATYLDVTNGNKVFTIGGDLSVDAGFLRFKQSGTGDVTINVGGTVRILNVSFLYGIYQQNGLLKFNAAGIDQSAGTFYGVYNGDGNSDFTVSGSWKQSGGDFRAIQNNVTYTAGVPSFQIGNVNYSGGVFIGNYSCNTVPGNISFVVTGNMNVAFAATTDIFAIHRLATLSTTAATAKLFFQVGGNLTISGVLGEFNSNNASGEETVNILGSINISGGNNYFNVIPSYGNNGHLITFTLSGNLNVSGGNTYLSAETGTLTANLFGNVTISSGTLSLKGSPGIGTINLTNNYLQTGGILNIYNDASLVSVNAIDFTINGNFTQSGGDINFSTLSSSTGINSIHLNGAFYTIGAAGTMSSAGAGLSTNFGVLNFNRNGTISMSRSGTHNIQQVKQNVITNCLLDVVTGNLQIASHATAATDFLVVHPSATLNLNANQIYSNAIAANSGISLLNAARLRTSHTSGFYNNTSVAALNNVGAMNFNLNQNSIVEYYGTSNQVLTGINVGLATTNAHKYGILEINNTGAGTYVTPTNLPTATTGVYIREELRLTNGIVNLAGAVGNPANGGRTVYVERSHPSAITRTNGFLRSEAQDHSGALNWNLANVVGTYTIPFAYSATEYIPLVYSLSSGSPGAIIFATYHTGTNNLPWPPSISNLNSLIGLTPDNRDATVDRFWKVAPSAAATATIEMNYLNSELPPSPYNDPTELRAQNYNFGTSKWQPALLGQSAVSYKVNVSGISNQSDWTLANINAPLPVEWLYFHANLQNEVVHLSWATASEVNNDYYLVERSKDMLDAKAIEKVNGLGNSSSVTTYEAKDLKPLANTSYYRIRQVDKNGTEEFTQWVAIYRKSGSGVSVVVGPNPSSEYIYVSGLTSSFQLLLFDVTGKLILHQAKINASEGINVKHLPNGVYTARFISDEIGQFTMKILKQ
jgi:Secretion system C-terminal sorting domain